MTWYYNKPQPKSKTVQVSSVVNKTKELLTGNNQETLLELKNLIKMKKTLSLYKGHPCTLETLDTEERFIKLRFSTGVIKINFSTNGGVITSLNSNNEKYWSKLFTTADQVTNILVEKIKRNHTLFDKYSYLIKKPDDEKDDNRISFGILLNYYPKGLCLEGNSAVDLYTTTEILGLGNFNIKEIDDDDQSFVLFNKNFEGKLMWDDLEEYYHVHFISYEGDLEMKDSASHRSRNSITLVNKFKKFNNKSMEEFGRDY